MTTFINLPHEIQNNISNYLRPHKWTGNITQGGIASSKIIPDPFSKALGVASIKAVHPELKNIPLWKNHEWKERIRKWRDENMTKKRWKYQYGVLPNRMIEMGWERKINHDYRHQGCYVETVFGKEVGTGFVVLKSCKTIGKSCKIIGKSCKSIGKSLKTFHNLFQKCPLDIVPNVTFGCILEL